jgi:hypothetical protein
MSSVVISGNTSGTITLDAPAVAGTTVLTLPATSGTVIVNSGAQTIEFADGSAGAPSITNSGDTNTGMFFPAADTIAFAEGGVEAMRLDSTGNVGIGTASPTDSLGYGRALDIQSTAGAALYLRDSDATSEYTWLSYEGGATKATTIGNTAAGPMIFATNGTNRMRITSSGSVGIGTANPSSPLHVLDSNTSGSSFYTQATSASFAGFALELAVNRGTTNNSYYFIRASQTGVAYRFNVADSGNVTNTNGSYGAISDAKLKENIVDASPKLNKLNQLKVRNYNFIGDDLKQIGFVAQEIEKVFPSIVETATDRDKEGNDLGTTTKSIKITVLIPMLVKAIQEQTQIINDIKTELDNVKTELATLKGAAQ